MPARARKKPAKLIRVGVAPVLSRREIQQLRDRAAADLRTLSNYASRLMVESLKRKRVGPGAEPGEKRRPYSSWLYLTPTERKRLEARAKAERRSVSGYVARGGGAGAGVARVGH